MWGIYGSESCWKDGVRAPGLLLEHLCFLQKGDSSSWVMPSSTPPLPHPGPARKKILRMNQLFHPLPGWEHSTRYPPTNHLAVRGDRVQAASIQPECKRLGAGTPGASFQCQPAGQCEPCRSPQPPCRRTIKPSLLGPFMQLNSCLQSPQKSLGGGMSIINWGKKNGLCQINPSHVAKPSLREGGRVRAAP